MTGHSRVRRILHRSWDTISLAVLVAGFLAASLPLGRIAGWIPRSVLSVTLVLIVIQLLIEIRAPLSNAPGDAAHAPAPARAVGATTPGLAALWLGGLLAAVLLLGTTIGSTVFSFAYLRWHARAGWAVSSGLALALGASVQLVFAALLQATLYPGWLWLLVR